MTVAQAQVADVDLRHEAPMTTWRPPRCGLVLAEKTMTSSGR